MCSFTGTKGFAYTLVTDKDKDFSGHLVRNLETANQYVPESLINVAMKVSTHHTVFWM